MAMERPHLLLLRMGTTTHQHTPMKLLAWMALATLSVLGGPAAEDGDERNTLQAQARNTHPTAENAVEAGKDDQSRVAGQVVQVATIITKARWAPQSPMCARSAITGVAESAPARYTTRHQQRAALAAMSPALGLAGLLPAHQRAEVRCKPPLFSMHTLTRHLLCC